MSRGLNSKQKEEVVISYNKLAMEQLQQDKFELSMSYLKQALMGIKSITEEIQKSKLMAITFNNLGCLFKRTKNYSEALKYLFKAIDLENKLPNEAATIAGAHLNICSILSQQKDHVKAIRHGLRSIFLLKSIQKDQPKHIPTLVIAYHNVSTEYQLLNQPEDAEDCLKVATRLSSDQLGAQHPLTITVKTALSQLTKSRSPGFDYFVKVPTPRSRFPIVSAKSRANSHESRKSLYREGRSRVTDRDSFRKASNPTRTKTRIMKKFEIQKPFVPKIFSEEEISIKTDKSFSSINSALRKIDLQQHKATERVAAVMIQSHWKGFLARKKFNELKINAKLKMAELKARRAVEEYEKLKQMTLRKKGVNK
jgi:tetratricopeptide (TPR) repeat protein